MTAHDLRKAIQAAKEAGITKGEIIKIVEEEFKSGSPLADAVGDGRTANKKPLKPPVAGITSGARTLASFDPVPPDEEPPSSGLVDALVGKPPNEKEPRRE